MRSFDRSKISDLALRLIASGGITSPLILPSSANIMGSKTYVVKSVVAPLGAAQPEERMAELSLEKGVDLGDRWRYMKMACGENSKRVYAHMRIGRLGFSQAYGTRERACREAG